MTQTAIDNILIFLEYAAYASSIVCGVAAATEVLEKNDFFKNLMAGDIEE